MAYRRWWSSPESRDGAHAIAIDRRIHGSETAAAGVALPELPPARRAAATFAGEGQVIAWPAELIVVDDRVITRDLAEIRRQHVQLAGIGDCKVGGAVALAGGDGAHVAVG